MIERQKVNGDPATVSYMTDEFALVPKSEATLVKIMFDDGKVLFLRPKNESMAADAKVEKASVNYRLGTPTDHCGICTMFREPDQCTAVEGEIGRHMLCDLFERMKTFQQG